MDLLITGRQMGKTTQAIDRVRAYEKSVLVVPTINERNRLRGQYGIKDLMARPEDPRRRIEDRRIIATLDVLSGRLHGMNADRVIIDNLDMVLGRIFGRQIELATMTRSGQVYMYGPSD